MSLKSSEHSGLEKKKKTEKLRKKNAELKAKRTSLINEFNRGKKNEDEEARQALLKDLVTLLHPRQSPTRPCGRSDIH